MMKAERRKIQRLSILIVIFILGIFLCPDEKAFSEEVVAVPSYIISELRPTMEFTGEGSREPFMDTIPQIKETEIAKPVVKQQKPALPALTIQGVIWGSSIPCIIINNKVLKEGEIISDVKIIKVGKEGVELSYKGWDYSLPSPAAASVVKNPEGGEK